MSDELKVFQVDEYTVYAAHDADEAARLYFDDTGEQCEEGYPEQMSDAWLDEPIPEYDENENPTGEMTTMRSYLNEQREPGYFAGGEW